MLSFVFWKLNCDKATMTLDQFCNYLKFFKFKVEPEEFGKEFEWTLKNKEGEMKGNEVIRFDLWRSIFL